MKNEIPRYPAEYTPMLEWADKVVSKTAAERRVGSNPTWSTKRTQLLWQILFYEFS